MVGQDPEIVSEEDEESEQKEGVINPEFKKKRGCQRQSENSKRAEVHIWGLCKEGLPIKISEIAGGFDINCQAVRYLKQKVEKEIKKSIETTGKIKAKEIDLAFEDWKKSSQQYGSIRRIAKDHKVNEAALFRKIVNEREKLNLQSGFEVKVEENPEIELIEEDNSAQKTQKEKLAEKIYKEFSKKGPIDVNVWSRNNDNLAPPYIYQTIIPLVLKKYNTQIITPTQQKKENLNRAFEEYNLLPDEQKTTGRRREIAKKNNITDQTLVSRIGHKRRKLKKSVKQEALEGVVEDWSQEKGEEELDAVVKKEHMEGE